MQFSFKAKKAVLPSELGRAKPALSVFTEALEEGEKKNPVITGIRKPVNKVVDDMLKVDPDIFKFDELLEYDEKKEVRNRATTDALEQAARSGLTVLGHGSERFLTDGKKKEKKEPQYVNRILQTKARREIEKQIIEQKVIDREIEKEGGERPEAFVTTAYKQELEKRKLFEKQVEEEERRNEAQFAGPGGKEGGKAPEKKTIGPAFPAGMATPVAEPYIGPALPQAGPAICKVNPNNTRLVEYLKEKELKAAEVKEEPAPKKPKKEMKSVEESRMQRHQEEVERIEVEFQKKQEEERKQIDRKKGLEAAKADRGNRAEDAKARYLARKKKT